MLRAVGAVLVGTLAACSYAEHASVIVRYDRSLPVDAWSLPSSGQSGVKDAFNQFTKRNGYQCRVDFKHGDELLCRGPNELHLSFRPVLNKSEFIATFSWMNTATRNHAEFTRLVSGFVAEMSVMLGESAVIVGSRT